MTSGVGQVAHQVDRELAARLSHRLAKASMRPRGFDRHGAGTVGLERAEREALRAWRASGLCEMARARPARRASSGTAPRRRVLALHAVVAGRSRRGPSAKPEVDARLLADLDQLRPASAYQPSPRR
jgi:hypothetical protein